MIGKCEQAGCQGHLGKFDDCLSEAVYEVTGYGFGETTGSVDFDVHVTLEVFTADHVHEIGHGPAVTIPAGAYTVTEDSRGFVDVTRHPSESAARAVFDSVDERYGEWLGDDE